MPLPGRTTSTDDADHDDTAADELQALEVRRCDAISRLDLTALGELLDAELTHVHATGLVEDRATYLGALAGRPRTTTPGPIAVRFLSPDVALMSGTLRNQGRAPDGTPRDGEIHALRVWRRTVDTWRMTAFAASPLGARR